MTPDAIQKAPEASGVTTSGIPPKLQEQFKQAGSYHKLADKLEINVSYVYNLLKKGIEPPDTTLRLRKIRRALHLPSHKRRPGKHKQQAPDHMLWWHRLGKGRQDQLIQQLHNIDQDSHLGPKRRTLLLELLYRYNKEIRLWRKKTKKGP
jgi:hypothetical protein